MFKSPNNEQDSPYRRSNGWIPIWERAPKEQALNQAVRKNSHINLTSEKQSSSSPSIGIFSLNS